MLDILENMITDYRLTCRVIISKTYPHIAYHPVKDEIYIPKDDKKDILLLLGGVHEVSHAVQRKWLSSRIRVLMASKLIYLMSLYPIVLIAGIFYPPLRIAGVVMFAYMLIYHALTYYLEKRASEIAFEWLRYNHLINGTNEMLCRMHYIDCLRQYSILSMVKNDILKIIKKVYFYTN